LKLDGRFADTSGMRIIGGEFRGRTLSAPPGLGTRPTADRTL